MLPWSTEPRGRFDEHVVESELLRGNPLGDPHRRPLWVYVPPGYDDEPQRRFPSIYVIQGYTGQLDMWRNRPPFGAKTFPSRAELSAPAGALLVTKSSEGELTTTCRPALRRHEAVGFNE